MEEYLPKTNVKIVNTYLQLYNALIGYSNIRLIEEEIMEFYK